MKDTNQLPPSEREAFEAEMRCEETWGHRSLKRRPDGRYQNWQVDLMWEAWQARAQVQGELEPYDAGLLNPFGGGGGNVKWWQDYIRAELGRAHDFYQSQIVTHQPAQATQAASAEDMKVYDSIADRYFREATQAEVTDADIEQVLALAHSYADAKLMRYGALGIKEPPDPAAAFIELRRAILALRPERVPMTDEQWLEYLLRNANNSVLHVAAFVGESIQTRGQWVLRKPANDLRKLVEQAYGITAQAKKEDV